MRRPFYIPEVTRASSRGQIVIPVGLRRRMGIREGSLFAVTGGKDSIVLRRIDGATKEDLELARLAEEGWEDIRNGRYRTYTVKEFFEEMRKWAKSGRSRSRRGSTSSSGR